MLSATSAPSAAAKTSTSGPSGEEIVMQMTMGHVQSAAIQIAAKLGIADLLANGPRPVGELANKTSVIDAALKAYDFSGIGTLVDVAGGHGMVLTAVLQKYSAMKGILCDLAEVIPGAQQRIRSLNLENRCRAEVADFFKSVPAGGDAYIMKHIIDRKSVV